MSIKENIDIIQDKIDKAAKEVGKEASDVTLVAVSKTVELDRIEIAKNSGTKCFGENYVQEFRTKIGNIDDVNWHFIGQLQSNKVKYIFREIYMLHSLDRISLAKELDKHLKRENMTMKVLVQVNISRETQKGGVLPEDTEQFLRKLIQFETLDVCGLMCIPAASNDKDATIRDFAATKKLFDDMKSAGFNMRYLSMGMSNDYEDAIKQGANIVRVGSAIFGIRA